AVIAAPSFPSLPPSTPRPPATPRPSCSDAAHTLPPSAPPPPACATPPTLAPFPAVTAGWLENSLHTSLPCSHTPHTGSSPSPPPPSLPSVAPNQVPPPPLLLSTPLAPAHAPSLPHSPGCRSRTRSPLSRSPITRCSLAFP